MLQNERGMPKSGRSYIEYRAVINGIFWYSVPASHDGIYQNVMVAGKPFITDSIDGQGPGE